MTEPRLLQLGDNSIDSNLLNDIQKLVEAKRDHKQHPSSPTKPTPSDSNPTESISIDESIKKAPTEHQNLPSNANNNVPLAEAEGLAATSIMSRIASTVSKMQQNESDAVIQWNGFLKLANWAENNYTNEVTISNVGGIDAILSAMEKHPENANIHKYGCVALQNLLNDNNQLKISNAGRKVAIESAMQYHSANAGVIEQAKRALSILQPISTTPPTPSSSNPTDPISIGRSKMKEAMDNVDLRPIELPKEFIISCTNNFAEERKLGHGSFGAVYKGMDDNQYFAVKCLRFNLDFLEDQKKGISKTFKKELEVSSSVVSSIACCFKSIMFLIIPSYCFRY